MVPLNPLTGVLHFWSVVAGIAGTLFFVLLLKGRKPRVEESHNQQRKLLPRTDDHDRFQYEVQSQELSPKDLEIGPELGSGTFGQVYRGGSGMTVSSDLLPHDG